MKQKFTIGIAAYNAEKNIVPLLESLISQTVFSTLVTKIIVHSDASSDRTVKKACLVKDKKIVVVDSKLRKGFAQSVITILNSVKGQHVLLLNDDFVIKDTQFLEKLVKTLTSKRNIGLVSGNPQPLPAKNLIQRAGVVSYHVFERMRYSKQNKNNKFTCDGKILFLSQEFIKKLRFPQKLEEMGNTDSYIYFSCLTQRFLYRYTPDAKVYFPYPSTMADYMKWQLRNNSDSLILKKKFGRLVDEEYKMPKSYFSYLTVREIIGNIREILFLVFVHYYVLWKKREFARSFSPTWEVIKTSKPTVH